MPILYQGKKRKPSKKEQSLARLERFRQEVTTDDHMIPLAELCSRLHTDPVTGLTKDQAAITLKRTGPNTLTPPRGTPEILKFLKTLMQGFSLLLWIGSGLCVMAGLMQSFSPTGEVDNSNYILGGVLAAVVLLTGMFTYYQERKSSKVMQSFAKMIPPRATVMRGGETMSILSSEVVIGDLIVVKAGDSISADIRIIFSQNFKVDNSALTGESEPQVRTKESTDANLLETRNVAFYSTLAVEGTATGIAIACGDNTVIGHIAGLTARLKANKTPLAKELERFMKIVSVWAIAMGLVIGLLSLMKGNTLLNSAIFLIGIIVANVPEGLLATVTVCLTVTAKRMAKENCLVKNLQAVETLGCTSVICSDKTGTLTQNKMTARHTWYSNRVEETYDSLIENVNPKLINDTSFKALARCAALCSRAEFLPDQGHVPVLRRNVAGDASEEAILKFVEMSGIFGITSEYRSKNPKVFEIPFSSATKFQVSIHNIGGKCLLVMKGAPERILERCNKIYMNGGTSELSSSLQRDCDNAIQRLASMGERVLGFCDLELDDKFPPSYPFKGEPPNFPQRGLRFLGFFSLIDPPRPQVPHALEKCKEAGIRVFMVTGDHPLTAQAIAQDVGIITTKHIIDVKTIDVIHKAPTSEEAAMVIHGTVLKQMSPDDLDNVIYFHKEIVFARTSPTQKLQIVEGCQRLGEIVAVTGDGVNDAPALKKADIGIAMGIAGTEVSKNSADMVLMDDNFASIITGIEEGRKIFDNLKKSIVYTLSSNVPELLPFILYVIIDIPLPIGVIPILCIDLLTDMFPAISLAYEKAETDIMKRPPRNPKRDKLVTRRLYFLAYGHIGLLEAVGGFLVWFLIMAEYGFFPSRIIGQRRDWDSESDSSFEDSYGIEWTYGERKLLQDKAQTAFLVSVVVTQWADLLVCKTRFNSLFTQGMGNHMVNISLVVETVLVCMLSYIPIMRYVGMYPVKAHWWLYCLPFAIMIFLFDEFRKWHIRRYPKGYFQRETLY